MKAWYKFEISASVEADDFEGIEDAADDIMEDIIQVLCQGEGVDSEHKCRYTDWVATYNEIDEDE